MRIKDYTQAAYELCQSGFDGVVVRTRLRELLEKRGLASLYPRVLRSLLARLERDDRTRRVRLIVARERDGAHALKEAHAHEAVFGKITKDAIVIDPSIIGGFIIERNNIRLDQSYKRTLLDTYRTLTS